MPIAEVTMHREEGMDMEQLREALLKKLGQEMLLIRTQGRVVKFDARPNYSDLTKDGMTIRWRYKQYKTT